MSSVSLFANPLILDRLELVQAAWTQRESMMVLADWALENVPEVEARQRDPYRRTGSSADLPPIELTPDHALFMLEASVRAYVARSLFDDVEIRHSGGWPGVKFVVTYVYDAGSEGPIHVPLSMLHLLLPDAEEYQPRLLYIEHKCSYDDHGACRTCGPLSYLR